MADISFGIFSVVSIVTAVAGLVLARGAWRKVQPGARCMSAVCALLAMVDIFYLCSIMPLPYRLVSLFSTLYFISINLMLYFLLEFIFRFTGHTRQERFMRVTTTGLRAWVMADAAVLLVNVWKEIALTYIPRHTPFAQYRYGRFFLYNCHLALSYLMVVLIVVLLVGKLITVPREYKRQYLFVVVGILVIVLINAAFLFIPNDTLWTLIDWSIMGYAIAAFVLYWTCFQYTTHGMLNRFKTVIFENMAQGLVLFDYTDHLILANEKARKLIAGVDFDHWLPMQDLLEKLDLSIDEETRDRELSLQCEVDGTFLRCDYSTIRNAGRQMLGHLFIFTNASMETDLLTGFQNKDNFLQMVAGNPNNFPVPSAVVLFDIDNLGAINSRYGREGGDRRIRQLAERMRSVFPKGSYYVRGDDAQLMVIVYHESEKSVRKYAVEAAGTAATHVENAAAIGAVAPGRDASDADAAAVNAAAPDRNVSDADAAAAPGRNASDVNATAVGAAAPGRDVSDADAATVGAAAPARYGVLPGDWDGAARMDGGDAFPVGNIEFALAQTSQKFPGIGMAVDHAERALRNKKLVNGQSAHSELLRSLEQALEQCDPDTRAHVERTRELGMLLGEKVGLTDLEQSQLSLLCLLHDIGKIGIPLEILNKPGKLDDQEWAVMRSHVWKGYEIARSSGEISDIADMILHHHERWDGKGYPDGLEGENIPLLSRFIGVVDSFDAMVHDRVYRKAMPVEAALAELERCAGTQFDPKLVTAFVQVVRENHIADKVARENAQIARAKLAAETAEKESARADAKKAASAETAEGENAQADAEKVASAETAEGENARADAKKAASAETAEKESARAAMEKLAAADHLAGSADRLSGHSAAAVREIPYTLMKMTDDLRVLSVDEHFTQITGYSASQIHYVTDLIPREDRMLWLTRYNTQMAAGTECVLEFCISRRDGETGYASCIARRYFNATEKQNRVSLILIRLQESDLEDRAQRTEKDIPAEKMRRREDQHRRDALTGLLSHEAFVSDVETCLIRGERPVLLLLIRIDPLKESSSSHGDRVGDEYLAGAADAIRNSIRKSDLAGRLGGNEFAIALMAKKDDTPENIRRTAHIVYDRICTELGGTFSEARIRAGAAVSSGELHSFSTLYEAADTRLRGSKDEDPGGLTFRS